MKKFVLVVLISLLVLVSCVPLMKLKSYPEENVSDVLSLQKCSQPEMYEKVYVFLNLPRAGTYQSLGTILLSQEVQWDSLTVANEMEIKEARIQACRWGSHAIIILPIDNKENRIIAIKFIEE